MKMENRIPSDTCLRLGQPDQLRNSAGLHACGSKPSLDVSSSCLVCSLLADIASPVHLVCPPNSGALKTPAQAVETDATFAFAD